MIPVTRADATFQVWDALRHNRRKRRQRGEFLIHGVRPLNAAVERDWPLAGVLVAEGRRRSRWAEELLVATAATPHYLLHTDLFDQLAEREDAGELIGLASLPPRALDAITGTGPVLVLDRPASPGNVGSVVRSADAFGAAGVVLLGHAADPYDPLAVRASMGSLFAIPVVELGGAGDLSAWLEAAGRAVIGLDEASPLSLAEVDHDQPIALLLGNEGRGLSAATRGLCSELRSIPMRAGAATSLNLAVAASIALYEVTREH